MIYEKGDQVSGPVVNQGRLFRAFQGKGHEMQVLCLFHGSSPLLNSFKQELMVGQCMPAGKFTDETIRWILEQVREFRPDVFIADWIAPGLFASRWIQAAGIPCIGSFRSDDRYFWSLMRRFAGRDSGCWAVSGVFCVSRKLETQITERLGGARARTCVLPSGVPFPEDPPTVQKPIRMAYVGRIETNQKQILATVEAMCRVVKEIPGSEGTLFGNGPEEGAARDLLEREGCSDKVRLEGAVSPDEIQGRLAGYNVIVLLSDFEGTPGAIMDGMAAGLVPVCLACPGGIDELVIDGETGILVQDREDGFVAAIRKLAGDNEVFRRLRENARRHIQEGYTLANTVERWEDFMTTLVGEKRHVKRDIRIPRRFNLPPVDPDMSGFDFRMPTKWDTFIGQCKVRLGAIKRRILMRN